MTLDDLVPEIEEELEKLLNSKKPQTKQNLSKGALSDIVENVKSLSDISVEDIENVVDSVLQKYDYEFNKGEKGFLIDWLHATIADLYRNYLTQRLK